MKSILRNLSDGEITISAYDTAWVALIDAGDETPAFPSAVKWIANNQLSDSSWGDAHLFSYHDRLINTLACVVALTSWNLFPHQCHKGNLFIFICKKKIRTHEKISRLSARKRKSFFIVG